MPLYEYHCGECERDCELLIRGDERPQCPSCGGGRLEKLLSVPAAHTSASRGSLPVRPEPGTCGRPQCGQFGCQGRE